MNDTEFFNDPEDEVITKPEGMTVDKAYEAGGPKEFLGKEFHGWSGRRRAATIESGFTGEGGFFDIVRVAYYCCIKYTKVSAVYIDKPSTIENIVEWGEKNKCLTFGDENFETIMELVQSVMEELDKSAFEPDDKDDSGPTTGSGNTTGHRD